jgi:glycogen operon protein
VQDGALPDVSWFSSLGTAVDWNGEDAALIALLTAPAAIDDPEGMGRDCLLLVNGTTENREFILPPVAKGTDWRLFIDTTAAPPGDIYPDLDGPAPPVTQRQMLLNRSLCCYVANSD